MFRSSPPSSVRLAIICWSFSASSVLTLAATIHVPADYSTIQSAINAASSGDTILVSDGTYQESIDFKGKAITVKSVNGPATTIIDAGGVNPVVTFSTAETANSVLDGFTIQNGGPSQTFSSGSGITVSGSSPTIKHNLIRANRGCDGAGINLYFSSPVIDSNTISNNSRGGCSGGGGGGGIYVGGASQAQIINNTISQNQMDADGGGIELFAAGTPLIRANIFQGNTASGQGGGIAMANQSDALVIDNLFIGNTAFEGGGVATLVPSGANGPSFINNTFANNVASHDSADVYFDGFANQTQFYNNIFVESTAMTAVECDTMYSNQAPIFKFNDVYNPAGTALGGSCAAAAGTNGNVSVDPLFVNPNSDFHLQATSPVIDAGSNDAPHLPGQDLAGNDRILDGNSDCSAIVDLGAYEYARPSFLTLNPGTLAFADQLVGSNSAAISSTITNTGTEAVAVCSVYVNGDFTETNTCGSAIAAKGSCTVNVVFSPTARGPRSGVLEVVTGDAGSPQSITLSGKGLAPIVALSPNAISFSSPQLVGTTSTSESVTLTNTGDGLLAISSVALTGDFSQTSTCGNTVNPAASCAFTITFTPTATGTGSGTLTITDSATGSPHRIPLSGVGVDFSLAVASGGSTSASIPAGGTATYTLQVAPVNGYTGSVTFVCSGAPSLSTCTVSPASVTINGDPVPFTVVVTTTAASVIAPGSGTPTFPPIAPVLIVLTFTFLLLQGAMQSAKRRPGTLVLLSAVFMILVLVPIVGCGGGSSTKVSNPGTPKGTYTLKLNATVNNVTKSLPLTLAVN
jgi:hypothetical protein